MNFTKIINEDKPIIDEIAKIYKIGKTFYEQPEKSFILKNFTGDNYYPKLRYFKKKYPEYFEDYIKQLEHYLYSNIEDLNDAAGELFLFDYEKAKKDPKKYFNENANKLYDYDDVKFLNYYKNNKDILEFEDDYIENYVPIDYFDYNYDEYNNEKEIDFGLTKIENINVNEWIKRNIQFINLDLVTSSRDYEITVNRNETYQKYKNLNDYEKKDYVIRKKETKIRSITRRTDMQYDESFKYRIEFFDKKMIVYDLVKQPKTHKLKFKFKKSNLFFKFKK